MLNRNTKWRKNLRAWFGRHKTARSFLMMARSSSFYREFWNIPKLYRLLRVFPYTLVSYPGLSGLDDLSRALNASGIEGAFVECGVWRGGCALIMAYRAEQYGREVHLFDSFEGLPEPLPIDGNRARKIAKGKEGGDLKAIGHVVASLEEVEQTFFEHFGHDRNKVKLHKGWFQDTLPESREIIGSIALLRLDGDWYESTRTCLENLYDLVVDGGYVVIDDYQEFDGCRLAVDEFLAERNLSVELKHFQWFGGSYFRK